MTLGIFMALYGLSLHVVGVVSERVQIQTTGVLIALWTIVSAILGAEWTMRDL